MRGFLIFRMVNFNRVRGEKRGRRIRVGYSRNYIDELEWRGREGTGCRPYVNYNIKNEISMITILYTKGVCLLVNLTVLIWVAGENDKFNFKITSHISIIHWYMRSRKKKDASSIYSLGRKKRTLRQVEKP